MQRGTGLVKKWVCDVVSYVMLVSVDGLLVLAKGGSETKPTLLCTAFHSDKTHVP